MYSYADMHCDTLSRCFEDAPERIYDGKGCMQGIRYMEKVRQMCQFFAVFFPPREENTKLPEDEEYFRILSSNLKKQVELHQDVIRMAGSYEEIQKNWAQGLASAVLTIEDGRMVNGKMEKLEELHKEGVRAIALTWNYANCFGFPNSREKEIMEKGLTEFGIEAIAEMNRLGILVDVSHLSDGGFYDVVKYSKKPFIASHSNSRSLTDHPRNLTDEMIRILAENGGVAGLNLCPDFVNPKGTKPESKVEYLVEHVLHFLNVGGEECIGIGTDFDGIEGPLEVGNPMEMEKLFEALHQRGVTQRQLEKIASGNVMRVIKESMY